MSGLKSDGDLLKVPIYVAGKSAEEVREELGLDTVVKMASNESAIGPSPMAIAALNAAAKDAHLYPGIADRDLRRKLAANLGHNLTEEQFLIGNGATDLIRAIAQCFAFRGTESVMSTVTFPMYAITTQMFGGKIVRVRPGEDYAIDLDGFSRAINENTGVVWVCSPNNPTGTVLSHEAVLSFIESLPEHVVTVLDEAYLNFITDPDSIDALEILGQGHPVIVLRSFSKSSGLAGLRVAYCVSLPEITKYLRHAMLPFHTGTPALHAASASMDDHEYMKRVRELVIEEREFLYNAFTEMGLKTLPSQANFLALMDLPFLGKTLNIELNKRGFIVRPLDAWGLADAIRITLGTREQNERLLEALTTTLSEIESASGKKGKA
jgi:histidinol-phosphate aminotransferase